MFSTGFSMNPAKLAEKMEGTAVNWMSGQAKLLGAVIMGSLIIKAEKGYVNRLIWMPA